MLMSMAEIATQYGPIHNIIHVGAHYGQEVPSYLDAGARQIDLFDPLSENIDILQEQYGHDPRIAIHATALGSQETEMTIYIASNQGQSSSLLPPLDHLTQYPHIVFPTSRQITVRCLDSFQIYQTDLLAMDVQGYELEVLKGASKTLKNTRMVYCEVNRAELYKNCAMVEDIDAFLLEYGMSRVATEWAGGTWGDALYIRREFR